MPTNEIAVSAGIEVTTLTSEINAFARSQPYWAQYLAQKIMTIGGNTANDIETAYTLFLEDAILSPKIAERPEIVFDSSEVENSVYRKDLIWNSLRNVEGVNALAEDQVIDLGPNLTVVYGVNGSGKSGYVRLLKKIFFSRSKEDIVGNVNAPGIVVPIQANLSFKSGEDDFSLKYPDDAKKGEFRQFAVFDDKSVTVHLNQRNQFEFRPAGLEFFSILIDSFRRLDSKVDADIMTKSFASTYAALFEGESSIKALLTNLADAKVLVELKKHLPFAEADQDKAKRLEERKGQLSALKKDKEILDLGEKKNLIATLKANIENSNRWFTRDSLHKIRSAIENCLATKAIAQKEGIENFKSDQIESVGSPEWRNFIEEANKFALLQGDVYPQNDDSCILCHQPLSSDAKKLIESYWVFIKSVAEKNAADAIALVNTCQVRMEKLNFNLLADDSILHKWLEETHPECLKKIKEAILTQSGLSTFVLDDLKNLSVGDRQECVIDAADLDVIVTKIEASIKELAQANPSLQIEELNKELTYLEHKRKLQLHFAGIEKYVADKSWAATAIKAKRLFHTKKITDQEKLLSSKYFNQVYIDTFNAECLALKADFGVQINHTGTLGTSFKQLTYKNHTPSAILSVGEQKVISIADFLAEIQLSKINKGIIFDDPVSSLDDERKNNIAERLVLESEKRQIIIFTHDLMFVSALSLFSTIAKVDFECHWIENNGQPGTVWLKNTPVFEKSYKTTGKAQEYYVSALKAGPQEREEKIKNGFAALRTSYEALVIFDLFGGVVQRFNERVSVDSLSSVYFDEDIRDEILDSFFQCCSYMEGHLHSDKYAYKKPEIENLKQEIERFNTVKKKLGDLKKSKKN